MYLCSKIKFWAKRARKIIVPPKEMLLSFSIGPILTNYDVTCRKLNIVDVGHTFCPTFILPVQDYSCC